MLTLVRILSVAASVAFSVLLLTTLLMVVPGNLEFIPPGGEESDLRLQGSILYLDTSFTIGNQGLHDITNFTFSVQAVVADQIKVTDYTTDPVSIPIGSRQVVPISIPVDVAALVGTSYVIFEPANVSFTMGVGGTTTRGFLDFNASFTYQQEFEALIPEFNIDIANSTPILNATGDWVMLVPYTVGTASFLSGNATADISIRDEMDDLVGRANETIPLGVPSGGNLTFVLTPEKAAELLAGPQDLTLDVALEMSGELTFSFQSVVRYDPGGG